MFLPKWEFLLALAMIDLVADGTFSLRDLICA
jgi:hypothetical protein